MFRNIYEANSAYLAVLAAAGDYYRAESTIFQDPSHWNSAEQRKLRELVAKLEGAEDTLGLTHLEANEGRKHLGLPERKEDRKPLAV